MDTNEVKQAVRERYSTAAKRVLAGRQSGCCGPSSSCCSGRPSPGPISANLYSPDEIASVPEETVLASLGCGNPTALAELSPGEVVLDLGAGGGIDVLLSARRVGPTGKAYGLDATEEMLALARRNQARAGVENAEFLHGEIEHIPLPAESVDVIISNCVINLSVDKDQVLGEAFRVLRPGGRFAVSDIVVRGELPPPARRSLELWAGCLAGALTEDDYRRKLARAGFADISVEVTRVYGVEDIQSEEGSRFVTSLAEADRRALEGAVVSAFVRARKPKA